MKITKLECYYAKVLKKPLKINGISHNYGCNLVKTSPNCEGCIFYKNLNSKEDMLSIMRNQKILDDLKKKKEVRYEQNNKNI